MSLHLSQIRKWFLQSPPVEWGIEQLRELLMGALRQGPVPQHVAFVMDGNRRFARKHQIETIEGHNLGFEALAKILEVCYKSGIRVVTVYAFSIENFKRSKYEVNALMDMAKVKVSQLAQHGEILDRYGARIQFLGQKEMVRPDVLEAIEKAIEITSKNSQAILNICAPYTSRDEITTAIRETVIDYTKPVHALKRPFSESHITRKIRQQHLATVPEFEERKRSVSPEEEQEHFDRASSPSDSADRSFGSSGLDADGLNSSNSTKVDSGSPDRGVSPEPPLSNYPDVETIEAATLNSHTFTAGLPPLELLIRTSGVERLSDFMLWQCHQDTSIIFLDCLWPEFDLWKFLPVLVEWQWRKRKGDEGGKPLRKKIKYM